MGVRRAAPGNFLKFQVYSDNFVKATITFEADHYSLLHILYAYFSRCMKMLQLAVIAVSNEKTNTKTCDNNNNNNTKLLMKEKKLLTPTPSPSRVRVVLVLHAVYT